MRIRGGRRDGMPTGTVNGGVVFFGCFFVVEVIPNSLVYQDSLFKLVGGTGEGTCVSRVLVATSSSVPRQNPPRPQLKQPIECQARWGAKERCSPDVTAHPSLEARMQGQARVGAASQGARRLGWGMVPCSPSPEAVATAGCARGEM